MEQSAGPAASKVSWRFSSYAISINRNHDIYFFRDWKFEHPKQGVRRLQQGYSMRLTRVGKNSLFSREVLYSLVLTNVLSLLLGAGIGYVSIYEWQKYELLDLTTNLYILAPGSINEDYSSRVFLLNNLLKNDDSDITGRWLIRANAGFLMQPALHYRVSNWRDNFSWCFKQLKQF